MKYCLKLATIIVLISQLLGFGVGSYWSAPEAYEFFVKAGFITVDQKSGTFTDNYNYVDSPMAREMTYAQLLEYTKSRTQPAEKRLKLTFNPKAFLKARGIPQETFAAVVIRMDKSRLYKRDSFIRLVSGVDFGKTPQQIIVAMQRNRNLNPEALVALPTRNGPSNLALHYFHLPREQNSPSRVAIEYVRRGLVPDLLAQALDNQNDPMLAYDFPNASQWRADGRIYSLTFDEDAVGCDICTSWHGDWWFTGVQRS